MVAVQVHAEAATAAFLELLAGTARARIIAAAL